MASRGGGDELLSHVTDSVRERLDRVARAEAEYALRLRGIDEEPVLAHLDVRGGQIGLAAARTGKTLEEMRRGHLHGPGQAQRRGRLVGDAAQPGEELGEVPVHRAEEVALADLPFRERCDERLRGVSDVHEGDSST